MNSCRDVVDFTCNFGWETTEVTEWATQMQCFFEVSEGVVFRRRSRQTKIDLEDLSMLMSGLSIGIDIGQYTVRYLFQ